MTTKKEALKRIYDTFRKLDRICESTREWDLYFDMCVKEEREHRRHAPTDTKFGLKVKEAAWMFSARYIFAALVPIGYQPQAKDFFHVKPTVFAGAAMADIKKQEILKAFTIEEMRSFYEEIDYVELIKV